MERTVLESDITAQDPSGAKDYTMKILREHTNLPVLIYGKSGLAHLSH